MSSSNFFLKPPVIFSGLILIALLAVSVGLKKQSDRPVRHSETEQTEFDRIESGGTRISSVKAPSISTRSAQATGNRSPIASNQLARKSVVEDFDTALRRASGSMYISGIVSGREPEQTDDAQNRQTRRDGTDTSSSRSDRENSWRDRWGRSDPLEAAEVLLFEDDPNTTHPPLRTAVTDKEGSFTLANINGADQRYILVVKAEHYAPEASFISVNNEPREVSMRLNPGVRLRGKVVDFETSQGVAGAIVYQPNPRSEAFAVLGVTTTSLTGEFSFPNTHPGILATQASADGYATTKVRVEAPDDKIIIEMQSGGASISGVTVDRLTGKPSGGARVWAKGEQDISESVVSAEDGSFKLDNLPAGAFDVYAVRGMKSEEQKIKLERRQAVSGVEIILPAELMVSGQVVHATERKPLQGIKVWYKSAKGAQYKTTNVDGRFAFETMAIDEYAILIHEKGFLPIQDKRTTEAVETLERKVAKNQSSDELLIRLRPVPTLEGNVKGQTRRGEDAPVNGANVALSYIESRDFVQLKTKSDPAGNFFFNLPKGRRGEGIVVATNSYQIDAKDVRVPRKNPVQLTMQRNNYVFGQLLLSDESSLDGVSIDVSTQIPRGRAESQNSHRVKLAEVNSMRGGRVIMGLPKGQDVQLTFTMPDGMVVSKDFQSDRLLNSRPIFVYDPVSQDIIADTTPRDRNRENGQGRNRGNGGEAAANRPAQPGGNAAPASPAQ